jgi:hypothetical protein
VLLLAYSETNSRCAIALFGRPSAISVKLVVHGGHEFQAARFEQPDQPLPQREEAFGDDNAHGTSMTIMAALRAGCSQAPARPLG